MHILLLKELLILQETTIQTEEPLAFKNNAPFIKGISKINNVLIDNAEGLDVVMPLYNFVEYSTTYKKTTGSLWNYYRDKHNIHPPNNYNANAIKNSLSFKYKSSITGSNCYVDEKITNAEGNEIDNPAYDANKVGTKEVEIPVPLKYLSNFGIRLDTPLINCEINLILTWSEKCVLTDMITRAAGGINVPAKNAPTNVTFKITGTKLSGILN